MSDTEHLHWTPVKRVSLSEEIADRIIESILSGRYRFGEKLPPERDLARYLNVGRPTVREAIRRLAVIGLVEVRPGEGTFVVNRHIDFVAKAFGWAVLLDHQTSGEIIETRVAVETELAGLAAVRANAGDVAELRRILDAMKNTSGDTERFAEADLAFHLALAGMAQNTTLSRLLDAIRALLQQWIVRALGHPVAFQLALEQHQAVLGAIEAGDEQAARDAMRSHLLSMGELLTEESRSDQGGAAAAPVEVDAQPA